MQFGCVMPSRRFPVALNLPGWCWAEIQQFALVGSSSSLHSEACNALGASDGLIHSSISREVDCMCASTNKAKKKKKKSNKVNEFVVKINDGFAS